MPPKRKCTREEVVAAALDVVRQAGIDALTAKTLAQALGVSTQPIFTCFSSMDELKVEVRKAAREEYERNALQGLREKIPFLGFGMAYLRFARTQPQLYRLLFLSSADGGALSEMTRLQAIVRPELTRIYRMTKTQADRYFRDMWLVVHSLATLTVTGSCPYSDEELAAILTGFSVSVCRSIKTIPRFAEGTFDRDAAFRSVIEENHIEENHTEEK